MKRRASKRFADPARSLGVLLDVRVSEASGGVLQAAMGLAYGLSMLASDGERYNFLGYRNESDWLRPFLRGNSRLIEVERPRKLETRIEQRLRSLRC